VTKLRKLLDAAARVARDPAIVAPLVQSTGLSAENVRLGLSRHLETATDEELAALERAVTPASHVHVILSPSVFVAPLRAIALGLAAGAKVTVKPSRRETCFVQALVEAFDDPSVTITRGRKPEDVAEGEIHAYGRNETVAAVRARSRVLVRGHASGMGVAVVTRDLVRAAEELTSDIVPFDQRGCLSPRVVFVAGDVGGFAQLLFDALESRGKDIPRGSLADDERAALPQWEDTVAFGGTLLRGESCTVGVLDHVVLPPTGRHVLVMPFTPPMPPLPSVIAVGTDDPRLARSVSPEHARVSALGMMQRPLLDGPVDLRAC
jgi:hypothetical protein